MKEEQRKQVEELIDRLDCPRGFKCYKSGFDDLPEGKGEDEARFIYCMEKNMTECEFFLPLSDLKICQCPLRLYIASMLRR